MTVIFSVMSAMEPFMHIVFVHKLRQFRKMDGNASVVGNALTVDLERQDQVNPRDGTPIILSVTRAINKETKGLLVQFVQRLIDIRRKRK